MCKIDRHLSAMIDTAGKSSMLQQHAAYIFRGNHPIAKSCNEIIGSSVMHAEFRALQCILRKDREKS